MSHAKKIFKGNFSNLNPSMGSQVMLINRMGDLLKAAQENGEDINERANNVFLWVGGLHKDIQLYTCNYFFNYCGIEFDADEKTEARLKFLEPFFKYDRSTGYISHSFHAIDHRPWAVEYLDGTTFEDRLGNLAEQVAQEADIDTVTVDMVLTGVHKSCIEDIAQAYALVVDCIDHLNNPSVVRRGEAIQRFEGWLEYQIPDIKIFGQSLVSKIDHQV